MKQISRRAVMSGGAAVAVTIGVSSAQAVDPDARLVAALRRSRELECAVNALDAWDDQTAERLADEFGGCHVMIAETPCHGVSGVAAKLQVLKWLRDNGSEADWEDDLLRTALATLERLAPAVPS